MSVSQSIGFCYLNVHGFLKIQPLTLDWLDYQFPDFFEGDPNLTLVNTPQTTTQASNNLWKKEKKYCIGDFLAVASDGKFFFDVSILLFSQVPIRYKTNSGNVENTQLRFGSPRHGPFLSFVTLVWVSIDTGQDQLTHCCVKLRRQVA